jgi:competence protein ComEC
MLLSILSFAVGTLVVQQLSTLPDILWVIFLLLLASAFFFYRFWQALFFIIGILWAVGSANMRLVDRLPASLEGQLIEVEAKIIGLPQQDERRVRFDVEVLKSNPTIPKKIRLSWFFPKQDIKAGQHWRFTVKLKKPHGRFNPQGFDYEKWLFIHNIGATGYIRNKPEPVKIIETSSWKSVAAVRQVIADKLNDSLKNYPSKGIIKALAIGEKEDLTQQQWAVYKNTGTVHLLAISGLHIGLIAGLAYMFVHKISLLFSVVSPQKMAAFSASVAALLYSALAGFSLPTQRALLMLSIAMLAISWQRNVTASHTLALTLLAVLIFDPFAVLSAGFWLSFFAVIVIVYSLASRLGKLSYWLSAIKIHWVTALGLAPFLVYFFQQVSIISPIANLFTVPVIGFLVVPLCLLAVITLFLSKNLADKLFYLLDQILQNLEQALSELAKLPYATLETVSPSLYAIPFAMVGVFILLSPKGFPARWLGLVMFMPLVLVNNQQELSTGEMKMTVFDVGQGLAAIIETSQHTLIFDTGAKYSSGNDMGNAVLLPYLKSKGIEAVDILLISHGDNDHIGGAESIIKQKNIKQLLTSAPTLLKQGTATACKAGQKWQWDGVDFEILAPPQLEILEGDNNNSCVLKVNAQSGSILLTGDIEKLAENWLLENVAEKLNSTVMIAPHHGSKTSSSLSFLQQVRPEIIVIPAGYKNRFSFPHQEVLERYQEIGATWLNTANSGAVTITMKNDTYRIKSARDEEGKYWNNK